MNRHHGLIDRIKAAQTPEEVHDLLREGREYPNADYKTKRRWNRVANRKLQEFFPAR